MLPNYIPRSYQIIPRSWTFLSRCSTASGEVVWVDLEPIKGTQKLYQHCVSFTTQAEELLNLLKYDTLAQEQYAAKLIEMSSLPHNSNGFGRDLTKSASILYQSYQLTLKTRADLHTAKAGRLKRFAQKIYEFTEAQSFVAKLYDQIEVLWKDLSLKRHEVLSLQWEYWEKSKLVKKENPPSSESVPLMELMITVGNAEYTVKDFNNLLLRLQRQVSSSTVTFLLKSFRNCYLGSDLLEFCKTLNYSDEDAKSLLTGLITLAFLKPIPNRFGYSQGTQYYQWNKIAQKAENEPEYIQLQREADDLDFHLKKMVAEAEQDRLNLVLLMTDFNQNSVKQITAYYEILKKTFETLVMTESDTAVAVKGILDSFAPCLETLDALKEVQKIAEIDKTGFRTIPRICYRNFNDGYHGVFCSNVPVILSVCLDFLNAYYSENPRDKEIDDWINQSRIKSIDNLCKDLEAEKWDALNNHGTEAIVAAIRMYLSELPISICHDETYESIKLLYLSKSDDVESMRISSLRSLLAAMPSVYFRTLALIGHYWANLFKATPNSNSKLPSFCQTMGYMILFPHIENDSTVHNKHPARLCKDLILHADELLNIDLVTTTSSLDLLAAKLEQYVSES